MSSQQIEAELTEAVGSYIKDDPMSIYTKKVTYISVFLWAHACKTGVSLSLIALISN